MDKKPNKQTLLILGVLGAALLWVGFTTLAGANTTNGGTPAPRAGFLAPDFTLTDLNGQEVSLSDFRGKPLIINFWASWCGPCRAEMPAFQDIYEKYEDEGFTILAINAGHQDNTSSALSFVEDLNLSLPILFDADGSVSQLYQVNSFPTTYFVDHEGMITEVVVGGPLAEALLAVRAEQLLEAVP